MEFINRFISMLIIFIIIVIHDIESTPNYFLRLSSLCPSQKHTYRLVRTPYGLRCVYTKKWTEKRSPKNPELPALESQLSDLLEVKNPTVIIDPEINSVTPTVKSTTTTKFKKVIIKNNRGPWKIANQIFERSPHRRRPPIGLYEEELAEYHLTSRSPKGIKRIRPLDDQKSDGLMVNQQIVSESYVKIPKLVVGSWMKIPEPSVETLFPVSTSPVITTTKMPKKIHIKSIDKTDNKKNFKNFKNLKSLKFKSDIEVLDLMEEDSVINKSFSRNMTNKLDYERRKTRSPSYVESMTPLTLPEISSKAKITPIKIYVFLNPNQTIDSITDSSDRYEIGERVRRPWKTTSDPTTSSTTTTTPTPLRVEKKLKELDFDVIEDKISDEDDSEEEAAYEDSYKTFGEEGLTTTAIPISRNWNFVCGDRKGFFADQENNCRTYYQCSVRGRQRFQCPPGTRFNQLSSICDWSENVNCLEIKPKNDSNDKPLEDPENSRENPILLTTIASDRLSSDPEEYEESSDDDDSH